MQAGGRGNLRTGHGFYVYRGGRLVVPGGWFRIVPADQFARLAWVRADVPVALDHLWKVDIRKSEAEPPQALREYLRRIVGSVTERSRRVYTYKGTAHRTYDHVPMWQRQDGRDGRAKWIVNRGHPVVAAALRSEADASDVQRLVRQLEGGLPVHEMHVTVANDLPVAKVPAPDNAGIAYSSSDWGHGSSSMNECLSVEADKGGLFLKSLMGMNIGGQASSRMSKKDAVAYYWDWLMRDLRR